MRVLVRFDTGMYAARRMKGRPGRDYIHNLSNLSAYITSKQKIMFEICPQHPFVGSSIV